MARKTNRSSRCHWDNRGAIPGAALATPPSHVFSTTSPKPAGPATISNTSGPLSAPKTPTPAVSPNSSWPALPSKASGSTVSSGTTTLKISGSTTPKALGPATPKISPPVSPKTFAAVLPATPPGSPAGSMNTHSRPDHGSDNNWVEATRPPTPPRTPPPAASPFKYPWEFGMGYPRPDSWGSKKVAFQWDESWISYPGKDVSLEWKKELEAVKSFRLPLPMPDMTREQLADVKAKYAELDKVDLYHLRLRHINDRYESRLIFSSSLPSLNGDMSSWSAANAITVRTPPSPVPNATLFDVLAIEPLADQIISYLRPSVRDLSSLAMTCKMSTVLLTRRVEVWDFPKASFPIDEFKTVTEEQDICGEKKEVVIQTGGVRQKTLLVTGAGNDCKTVDQPYTTSMMSMLNFLRTIKSGPLSFQHVVLHNLPYLDTRMLELVINSMPNLETLSIQGCILLDFSTLPKILDVIRRHPRTVEKDQEAKKNEPKKYIKVDFAPYRFFGPRTANRHGSFLITHNKPTFDIAKAATAILLSCFDRAKEVGMDLLSDSSSFWHFLRQLPGPCDLWAVKTRESIMRGRHCHGPKDLADDNLCAAVAGDYRAPETLPARRVWYDGGKAVTGKMPDKYWRLERNCHRCKTLLPESLLLICNRKESKTCWGCSFQAFVEQMEHSHFRYEMRKDLDILFQEIKETKSTRKATIRSFNETQSPDLCLVSCTITDMAWAHYKDIKINPYLVNTIRRDRIQAPYFPDRDPGERGGVPEAVRRWTRHFNPLTGPIDFRQGGPQYTHPCLEPELGHGDQTKITYGAFMKQWDFRYRVHQQLKTHFKKDFETGELTDETYQKIFPTDESHQSFDPYCDHSDYYRMQKDFDYRMYCYCHSRIEDDKWSLASSRRIIYNLDKDRKDGDWEAAKWNSLPYCSGRI